MPVSSLVVSDHGSIVDLIGQDGSQDHIGVVGLVVVTDPRSDEPPCPSVRH